MTRGGTAKSRWPRTLMYYFLAAMLMLTILSRAADSIMLPVVKCERPFPGALKHTTVLSGVIHAREQWPVMPAPGLVVARVNVREGQSVKAGDTLLTYDAQALEEALRTAEHALKQQQTEREKAAGSAAGAVDEGAVHVAELALARAEEDLRTGTGEQDRAVQLAKVAVREAEAELNHAKAEGETAFAEAYAAHMKSAKEALSAADKELYEARVALDWARGALTDRAKNKYKELQAAVDRAQAKEENARVALADANLAMHRASDTGEKEKARRKLREAQEAIEAAARVLEQAQIRRDRIPGARDYTTKRRALEQVQDKYDKAKRALNDAEQRAGSVVREIEQKCEGKLSAIESAETTLLEKRNALESAEAARDTALRTGSRTLEDAKAALAEKRQELKELTLDVQLKDEAIMEKKNEVDMLRRTIQESGTMRAPADGVIGELIVKPGDTTSGAALRLSPASSGLVVRAYVTEDDAKYLTLGMEARFQLSGGTQASDGAVLKGLTPTATGYEASFDLPDGVGGGIGQAVTITTSQDTETYPMRVPLGAIVYNGNIRGVYRIRTGQSVLGDVEYAEFVATSVIETDAQYAAIDPVLSEKDQVIVSKSKPLNPGDRIRSSS